MSKVARTFCANSPAGTGDSKKKIFLCYFNFFLLSHIFVYCVKYTFIFSVQCTFHKSARDKEKIEKFYSSAKWRIIAHQDILWQYPYRHVPSTIKFIVFCVTFASTWLIDPLLFSAFCTQTTKYARFFLSVCYCIVDRCITAFV